MTCPFCLISGKPLNPGEKSCRTLSSLLILTPLRSDGEEPLAGLSHRMKERLGGSRAREDEEKERKRRRREETRRAERSSDAKPTISKYRMDLMQRNAASAGWSTMIGSCEPL